jgi:FlaA1/EpsC-like NDP-sugar epimerase
MLENQIREAVQNNILGTIIVAKAAINMKAKKFILISTDKAVNPINVMGITKRIVEMLCQQFNSSSLTKFVAVRFGNVLGSVGSVVPTFTKQLEQGGPITVTHPDMSRFFMTIVEACQLILQSLLLGEGGETFVLDMGEPIKIQDLAEKMIRLSGKVPHSDIKIEYTGLRPGERLHETLFYSNEQLANTDHQHIQLALPYQIDEDKLFAICSQLEDACNVYNQTALHNLLQEIINLEISHKKHIKEHIDE